MSQTSNWPLPESGERILLPALPVQEMAGNTLCSACYPLAVGYYPSARGHQMSRPQPQDYLVIYCVDGAATLEIDDSPRLVTRGDLLLLPPHQPHRYQADPEQPWTLYWMHLDGDDLAGLFRLLDPSSSRVIPIGLHEPLITDWRSLLNLLAGGSTPATLMHAGSLSRAMLTYVAMLASRPAAHRETLDVDAVHQLMQQRLDQRLTLAELARAAGESSPWQFIRRYRAATGQTPMQAFLHRKIARACYLLEVSDLPVAEVASQFGFDDPYYFSRLFRKITGISPAHYRQQGRR
ncbi:MAG: helix-turn-helix domain-containing protein [Alcanivoracaceae bacterium]